MSTALAYETEISSTEVFNSFEAQFTIETVLEKLDERIDMESVARSLENHQPGDHIDMSAFERQAHVPGLPDQQQPHFYRKYVSDKSGVVTRTGLDSVVLSNDYKIPEGSLVLEKREDNQDFAQAFKARGAMMAVLDRVERNPDARVFTTASAGNHALGLLMAVNALNNARIASGEIRTDEDGKVVEEDKNLLYEAHIYCSRAISQTKYDRLIRNGAYVFKRESLEEGLEDAKAADEAADVEFVHPYDDQTVIAGQATLAVELLFDLVDKAVDLKSDDIVMRIPVGGGGLFAGVASVWEWAKAKGILNPDARLVAAEMELCDSASRELNGQDPLGKLIDTDTEGLATQAAGRKTLPVIEWYSDGGVTVVSKDYVMMAAGELAKLHGDKTPELAAVVSLAATLQEADQCVRPALSGRPVHVTLTTGSNIAPEMLTKNSKYFAGHEDVRVADAAVELGHKAMRLAFLNVSAEQLRRAGELESEDPSIVLLPSSEWSAANRLRRSKQTVTASVGLACLNGATRRDYTVSPLTGL